MIVTVIGSRTTPQRVLNKMVEVNRWLMKCGVTLRSGAAGGADATVNQAYNENVNENIPSKVPEVFIPWSSFGKEIQGNVPYIVQGDNEKARKIAESIHPAWDRCSRGARALHTRNVCQILGSDLETPADVVLYWCREKLGKPTGGTATAVNLALSYTITCINMLHDDWAEKFRKALGIPV